MARFSFLGLCVTLFILGSAYVGAFPADKHKKKEKKLFSLEDLVPATETFTQRGFNGTWISESEVVFMSTEADTYIFNVVNNTANLYITKDQLDLLNTTQVTLSVDRKTLLAKSDPESYYRYSNSARYALYDIANNTTKTIADHVRLQYCTFIGEGNAVVFVLNNNVYYKNGIDGKEVQITFDGVPGVIYNGVPDWVYEEEVFSSSYTTWASPDSKKIAFASFNDTLVDEAVYLTYGLPGSKEDQYQTVNKIRYPKAGRTNPTVRLQVKDLSNLDKPSVQILAPIDEVSEDHILGAVTWASDTELAAMWLNRRQNKSVLMTCDVTTGSCKKEIIREEPEGWIDVTTPLFSKDNGSVILDIVPLASDGGKRNQWFHVAQYKRQPGNLSASAPEALSSGQRTAVSIVGWNQKLDTIYYLSTLEGRPWERHLFRGSTCISCTVVLPGGTPCTYASATAPPHASYYSLTCQAGDSPAVSFIYNSETNKPTLIWEDNGPLRELLEDYVLPVQRYMVVPVPASNATVKFFLPPSLNPSNPGDAKYPMVVNIYAGPNSARVIDPFSVGYQTYIATNRSIIYCLIDGRGSGLKGKDSLFSINNRLGSWEVEDIVYVTRILTELFPWIDSTRVGLWGWSYGGYATAMALTKDWSLVFRCGLSVAPVTSWLYYDSIYAERYMGLPTKKDNIVGYMDSDITQRGRLMTGHHWMVLHGNADDNVHYQNSMAMSRVLQQLDLPFEQMSYPEEDHGLSGVTKHVYHTIDDYWTRCFAPSNTTSFAFG